MVDFGIVLNDKLEFSVPMLEVHVGIYTTMVVYNSDHRSVEVM